MKTAAPPPTLAQGLDPPLIKTQSENFSLVHNGASRCAKINSDSVDLHCL